VAWPARVHVHADDTAIVTRVRFVFAGEQGVDFGVEGGCIYPEQGRGVEDCEGFFAGEFAGEEEWWLGDAVLFGYWDPIGIVEGIFVD